MKKINKRGNDMIKVAILGYGTVGSGVFEIIKENGAIITEKAGQEIDIKYVLDLRDFPGDPCENVLVHDYNIILNDPEVDVVIEVMGGLKPGSRKKCMYFQQGACGKIWC
jgi:homoserine dehydrogenase